MRRQILTIFFGIMALTLLLSHSFITRTVSDLYTQNERQQLDRAAVLFASQNKDLALDQMQSQADAYATHLGMRITIISAQEGKLGEVLLDTEVDPEKMVNHAQREEVSHALKKGEGFTIRESTTTKTTYLYASYRYQIFDGQMVVLRLAKPVETLNQIQSELTTSYAILTIGLLLAGMLLFSFLTNSVLRPLNDLSSRIKGMEKQSAITLLPSYKDPQVDQLADSFNELMVLLDENVNKLRQNNQELENIFENVTSGLITMDQNGRIRVMNQPAEELLGFDEMACKDQPIYNLVRQPGFTKHMREVTELLEVQEFEIQWDNDLIYQIQLSPILKENNPLEVKGILMVIEDRTQLRNTDNMRKDFVANVSHELKTPLTTIRGFVETLLHDDLNNPAVIRKFLSIIDAEADRLQTMILQLLYLSKLDSKLQEKDVIKVSLAEYMEGFLIPLEDRIAEKAMTVSYEIKPENLVYQGSETLLHQVLSNLLENALSYSQGTHIDIRFSEKPNGLFLEVVDDGIGIAKKEQARIYERFYRVEKSRAQSQGGTGLGLAIVKHLVNNVGGKIKLKSDVGAGAHFMILLPFSQKPSP